MEELSSKMRNQVKRCFKTMRVERISSEFLLKSGYEVYVKAAENYAVKMTPPTREEFEKRIRNANENDYWGVIDIETENLVAFSLNLVTEEMAEYCTMKAIPEYQKKYAYYGLIYEMNRYYLQELKLKYVNDGQHEDDDEQLRHCRVDEQRDNRVCISAGGLKRELS